MNYVAEYALLQWTGCSDLQDHIDDWIGWVCLRWSTNDEMDHMRGSEKVRRKRWSLFIGEGIGVDSHSTTEGTVSVLQINYISWSSGGQHWPQHQLYLLGFARITAQ